MVMPIGNIKVTCLDCGWHKVIYQSSDVVMLPKQCEKCGGERLSTEIMTMRYMLRKTFRLKT